MAPNIHTHVFIGIGSVFLTVLGAIIIKKLRKEKIPTEWRKVGTLKELYFYPLKSGKGIPMKTILCSNQGLREIKDNGVIIRDRSFLIYTSKDSEVRTARQLPKTVQIEIHAAENGVILSAPNKNDLYISIPKVKNNKKVVLPWSSVFGKETFSCTDCGDSAAKWLSNFLLDKDEGLRLGYGDGSAGRNVLRDHAKWAEHYNQMDNNMAGIFSDLAALHLVNQATVDDLNEKLDDDEKVSFLNFRPNFLIEGVDAFEEDSWQYVKIGEEVIAKVCLECLRCIEATVSPSAGVMSKQREPLKTLEKYRKSKGPFSYGVMGIYLMVLKGGNISVGDDIYVPKSV